MNPSILDDAATRCTVDKVYFIDLVNFAIELYETQPGEDEHVLDWFICPAESRVGSAIVDPDTFFNDHEDDLVVVETVYLRDLIKVIRSKRE